MRNVFASRYANNSVTVSRATLTRLPPQTVLNISNDSLHSWDIMHFISFQSSHTFKPWYFTQLFWNNEQQLHEIYFLWKVQSSYFNCKVYSTTKSNIYFLNFRSIIYCSLQQFLNRNDSSEILFINGILYKSGHCLLGYF